MCNYYDIDNKYHLLCVDIRSPHIVNMAQHKGLGY